MNMRMRLCTGIKAGLPCPTEGKVEVDIPEGKRCSSCKLEGQRRASAKMKKKNKDIKRKGFCTGIKIGFDCPTGDKVEIEFHEGNRCKTCCSLWTSKYRKENPEKVAAGLKKWNDDNPSYKGIHNRVYYSENTEAIKAQTALYRLNNPEKVATINQAWRDANREYIKIKNKITYEDNQDAYVEYSRNYRKSDGGKLTYEAWTKSPKGKASIQRKNARRRRAEGDHTVDDWMYLISLCGDRCLKCKEKYDDDKKILSLDHVVPLSWKDRGDARATNRIDNIQPLCKPCNSSKRDRNDIDYRTEDMRREIDKL